MKDGAKLYGTLTCVDCGTDINWYHLLRQRASGTGLFSVATIKEEEAGATVTRKDDDKYQMYVHCKQCGTRNDFDYEDK